MWDDFRAKRGDASDRLVQAALSRAEYDGAGIGTPDDMRRHLASLQEAGVDQVIFMQQAGRNPHANICESLELFASEVMPEFAREVAAREAAKAVELAPFIEAALACFVRKGYVNTTMNDIVVESGLSKGAIYWYFEGKDDLFEAALTSVFESVAEESMGALMAC